MKIFKIIFLILFSFLFSAMPLFGGEILGVGYGETEKAAKKEALADLSQAIMSEVHSEFKTRMDDMQGDIKRYASKIVQIKSNLPILAPDFRLFPSGKEIMAEVRFVPDKARALYIDRLKQLKKDIEKSVLLSDKTKKDFTKHEVLTNLLSSLDRFYRYKTVAIMIGCKALPEIEISEAEIKELLRTLEKSKINSIDLAAKVLAKGMDKKAIYVYPPRPRGSNEITPFGSLIKDKLSERLNTVLSPQKGADYLIRGDYEKIKEGISLTISLIDTTDYNVVKTGVVTLSPEAYRDFETEPSTIDFDKLLHTGIIKSSGFRIEVSTNRGKQDLLFKEGDEIELFIKINSPGYFYVIGHTIKQSEKFSYLLELNEAQGNRRFIYHVNADDMNKWIGMGAFTVEPPFGVESLQIIASDYDLVDKLLPVKKEGDYYVMAKNPEAGIKKTRGLIKKKNKNKQFSEAVLMFTSMKK